MAAITTISRYQGVNTVIRAYAATDALVLNNTNGLVDTHVCYAQLTGAITINVTATGLLQFDRVTFHFSADGTNRIVTLGTGFVSSGTITVTASKDATVVGVFDGTNIKITSREIGA